MKQKMRIAKDSEKVIIGNKFELVTKMVRDKVDLLIVSEKKV